MNSPSNFPSSIGHIQMIVYNLYTLLCILYSMKNFSQRSIFIFFIYFFVYNLGNMFYIYVYILHHIWYIYFLCYLSDWVRKKDKLDGSFEKLIFFSIYLEKLWYIGICFLCWSKNKIKSWCSDFIYTWDNQYKKKAQTKKTLL